MVKMVEHCLITGYEERGVQAKFQISGRSVELTVRTMIRHQMFDDDPNSVFVPPLSYEGDVKGGTYGQGKKRFRVTIEEVPWDPPSEDVPRVPGSGTV